jgi:hypothetical protein
LPIFDELADPAIVAACPPRRRRLPAHVNDDIGVYRHRCKPTLVRDLVLLERSLPSQRLTIQDLTQGHVPC